MSAVETALQEVRESIDIHHKQWFDVATTLAQRVNVCPPELHRRCMRQTARDNTPADTLEMYYKHTVSITFLDELIGHLRSQFANIQQQAMRGLIFVPSVLMDDTLPKPTIHEVVEYYGDDLPTPSSLDAELHLWQCKMEIVHSSSARHTCTCFDICKQDHVPQRSWHYASCVYTTCHQL